MKLNDHGLKQIDEPWLRERSQEELVHVSLSLLEDLKAARERLNQNSANSSVRERLNQNSANSSVPSGSEPPWIHPSADNSGDEDGDENEDGKIKIPPPPEDSGEYAGAAADRHGSA